jgi:glycosyltransferase involved in cell wall biosynthesis
VAAIVEVCDYHGPYAGNFIPSLLAVGAAVRERLGMEHILVFPEQVAGRPWVQLVREAGYDPVFAPAGLGVRDAAELIDGVARPAGARLLRSHFTRFDLPAGLAGRRIGARVIWNVHSGMVHYDLRHRATDVVKVRLLGRRLCDRLMAVSDEIGREAVRRGHRRERVSVVLNGIELSRFAEEAMPSRAEARRQLGIEPDEPVLLAFCWAPFVKGADLVAEAASGIGATALLVGGDDLRTFLGELPDRVRVIAPVDDPRRLYAAADVFVSASRQEAFSYAIGEAMACRLPIASSRIPGPAAYFDAPGLLTFDSGDAGSLAEAAGELLRPEPRDERGAANRRFVADRLGIERHVERVLEVFGAELSLAAPRGD